MEQDQSSQQNENINQVRITEIALSDNFGNRNGSKRFFKVEIYDEKTSNEQKNEEQNKQQIEPEIPELVVAACDYQFNNLLEPWQLMDDKAVKMDNKTVSQAGSRIWQITRSKLKNRLTSDGLSERIVDAMVKTIPIGSLFSMSSLIQGEIHILVILIRNNQQNNHYSVKIANLPVPTNLFLSS